MDSVRRVVIRDKHPVLEPDILSRPINRVVLAVAVAALGVQAAALVQVVLGHGTKVTLFSHVTFAVVAFLWLALGVFVFLQRRAGRAGRLFLFSAAAGSMFLAVGTLFRESMVDALIYAAGLLLFPPLLWSFCRAVSEKRPPRWAELLLYVPALALIYPGARDLFSGKTTLLWKACLLLVALYLVAAIVETFRDLLTDQLPEEAAQTRALLFGLVAGAAPGVATYVIPLVVTSSLVVSTGWLPPIILVFLLAMSYAVLLFEFSEADLIVRRGVVYGVLTLVIVVAYGVLGAALAVEGAAVTSPGGGVSFVVVTVLIGAAFTPIQRAARRLVDWLLYGRKTDRWKLLQALSGRLSRIMQPDELGEVLVRETVDALHLRGAFLLRRMQDGRFVLRHRVTSGADSRSIAAPDGLCLEETAVYEALGDPASSILLVHAKPLTSSRRQHIPDRYRVLDNLGSALTIPLATRSGVEAVLCLQPKLSHDAFDADDLELLVPVIRQATAALDNALLFSRLDDKVAELRQAYMRIAHEQEAERARLARELHDGTAQELAGLITLATVIERQLATDTGAARVTLKRLQAQAEDAYQEVRRASHALRPPMLDDFGLVPTLQRYLDQFAKSTGIAVDYDAHDVGPLSPEVELALFRVAQECMENVRKHSGSDRAAVELERHDGHVTLSVADAGQGISEQTGTGIGLEGMRERIEAVGGAIRVVSTPGGGVRIEVQIPVEQELTA